MKWAWAMVATLALALAADDVEEDAHRAGWPTAGRPAR